MKDSPLSRFRKAVYTASAFIFLALLAAVPAAFNILDIRWAASIAGILLLTALLVLNYRSETAARLFQRLRLDLLIPSLKEVVDHHKKLQNCRQVMRRMEHTLEFYDLWGLIFLASGERKSQADEAVNEAARRGWFRRGWARLRANLRWEKLGDELDRDPNPPQKQSLPNDVVVAIMDADDEQDQVRRCAQSVLKHALKRVRSDYPPDEAEQFSLSIPVLEVLLELLYRERFLMDTRLLWQEKKGVLLPILTDVLLKSKRLPPAEDDLPYGAVDLLRILQPMEEFRLDKARGVLLADLERRRQNRNVVEKMTVTLEHYNLFPYLEKNELVVKSPVDEDYFWKEDFRRCLIDAPHVDCEEKRIAECARMIIEGMPKREAPLSATHLTLLYQELHGFSEQVRLTWRSNKALDGFLQVLAEILLHVPGFPKKEGDAPYTPLELVALMQPLEGYSLDQVKDRIVVDQKIRDQTRDAIQKMTLTLNLFGLFKLLKPDHIQPGTMEGNQELATWFQDELVKTMMATGYPVGEDNWINAFTDAVSQHLDLSRDDLPTEGWERLRGDLLGLLYRDHHGINTTLKWHTCKWDPSFLTSLVTILLLSKRLPQPDPDLPYGPDDLLRLLEPLEHFSLDEVRSAVLADQERRKENRTVVVGMMAAMDDYGLYALLDRQDYREDLRRELIDEPRRLANEQERVEHCAAQIAARTNRSRLVEFVSTNIQAGRLPQVDEQARAILNTVGPVLITDLLTLLYGEYHRREVSRLWRSKVNAPGFALTLGVMLLQGGKLPLADRNPPYGVLDLERILKALPEYSYSRVMGELEQLNHVWQLVTDFSRFLDTNDIPGRAETFGEVLAQVRLPLEPSAQEEMLAKVLTWVGQQRIARAYPQSKMPDLSRLDGRYGPPLVDPIPDDQAIQDLARSLSLIAVIIFITEELTGRLALRQRMCEEAGRVIRAPYIILGYLEYKEYVRREMRINDKQFVSVEFLAMNWAHKALENARRFGMGFHKEIDSMRDELRDGEWPRRLPLMIERTIKNISEKHERINRRVSDYVKRKPNTRKIVEAAFRNLHPETIARYLEARTRTAYLLTFRVRGGTLAELLKILASEDQKVQDSLTALGVDLFADGARIYNFQQYTDSARIGIIPEGWTFDRFEQAFQKDFEKVIAARTSLLTPKQLAQNLDLLEDIEIILSRFGLSGQNYYGFKMENLTQSKAIYQIQSLFSQILNVVDLATVIEYQEESLGEVLLNLPIVELVACQAQTNEDERLAMRDQDYWLKQRLTRQLRYRTTRTMALGLAQKPGSKPLAITTLAGLLGEIPQIQGVAKAQNFAKIYIDTLVDLASLV